MSPCRWRKALLHHGESNPQIRPTHSCKQNIVTATPCSLIIIVSFDDTWPAAGSSMVTPYLPYITPTHWSQGNGSHNSGAYCLIMYCANTLPYHTTCKLKPVLTCRSLNPGTVTMCDDSWWFVTNVTAEVMVSAKMTVGDSIIGSSTVTFTKTAGSYFYR